MPEYLRASQIAEILGISPAAVYVLFHRSDFPVTQISRRSYRVQKTALLKWIDEHTNASAQKDKQ